MAAAACAERQTTDHAVPITGFPSKHWQSRRTVFVIYAVISYQIFSECNVSKIIKNRLIFELFKNKKVDVLG